MSSAPPHLVITTINPPTRTVTRTGELQPDWHIVVVGDGKTPADWQHDGASFLSLDDQLEMSYALARSLPVGHYSRKNLGYVAAIAAGAPVIAETDDDNFPYDDFLTDIDIDVIARPVTQSGWVNVYRCFTAERIWPRGFPLQDVRASLTEPPALGAPAPHRSPVQQFLADGDPDVDAVYRLVLEGDIRFARDLDVVVPPGSWCPFNSQNTVWFPEAYPLLYLPSTVSFRMTDIWRSFVAARCLAAIGVGITFRGPTVYQERNEHDLLRDFAAELDGYLNNTEIVARLAALSLDGDDLGDHLRSCYEELHRMELVTRQELDLVNDWLAALAAVT